MLQKIFSIFFLFFSYSNIYNLENENFWKIRGRDIYFDNYELNKENDNEGNVQ